MNIINEQARANSKKTQHDASANVFNITLEKVYSYKSEKIIITKKTMKMKPLTNAEDNWGGGWRQQTI